MFKVEVLIPSVDGASSSPPCFRGCGVLISTLPGRAVARNDLAKRSQADYLLFLDGDIKISEEVFKRFLEPAIKSRRVVAYEGGNPILCSRVLGIPKDLLFSVGGFDESFDVGEDQELGYALLRQGWKIHKIPRDCIQHVAHRRSGGGFINAVNRARFILRYKRLNLFLPKRKTAPLSIIVVALAFYRYLFSNQRKGIEYA